MILDPAVTLQKKREAEYAAAQKLPPLNPPFPFVMQPLDPFVFGLQVDPPEPVDSPPPS